MSDKKLTVLGIIAVLVAALAILQGRISRQATHVNFGSSPLIAGLNIEAVSAIAITSQNGSRTVTLSQQDGRFGVADKDNYPADVGRVNTLISDCLDIRVTEKVTSNAANHTDLKVTIETAAYVMAFMGADGEPIVTMVLSLADAESGVAHGRLLDSDDVYTIQTPTHFNTSAMEFIDSELVTVQRQAINSVAIKTPEGNYVLSVTESGDDIELGEMPEGKQFKDTIYKAVFGALSSVRFDDVQKAENAPADLEFNYSYICKLKDLTVYKFSLAKKDDAVYAKVSSTYLDASPVEKTVGEVESDEELKKKETKLLAIDRVKAFTAQHREWVYQIPSAKAEELTTLLSELIEDIPQPDEMPEPEANPLEQATL